MVQSGASEKPLSKSGTVAARAFRKPPMKLMAIGLCLLLAMPAGVLVAALHVARTGSEANRAPTRPFGAGKEDSLAQCGSVSPEFFACAREFALDRVRDRSPRLYDLLQGPRDTPDFDVRAAHARLLDAAEGLRAGAAGTVLTQSSMTDFASLVCALRPAEDAPCTQDEMSTAARLGETSPLVRAALLAFLNDFLDFTLTTRGVFGPGRAVPVLSPPSVDDVRRGAPPASDADLARLAPILERQADLVLTAYALETAIDTLPTVATAEAAPCTDPTRLTPAYVRDAIYIDLGTCSDHYRTDVSTPLLIDGGGHDQYHGFTGGSNTRGHLDGDCWSTAGALLDLGAGRDVYNPIDWEGRAMGCGQTGGGYGGAGFLYDDGGSDKYETSWRGTNGGGNVGVGFLLDRGEGRDLYQTSHPYADGDPREDYYGGASGSNGGGYSGVGTLIDAGGSDSYPTLREAANGGADGGVGFLLELGGDDSYLAGGYGTNGGGAGAGSSGNLWDTAGSDGYVVHDVYGAAGSNGGGYNLGSGGLYDAGGSDAYGVKEGKSGAGTNGASMALGTGLLVDLRGDDTYSAADELANGASDGLPAALLFDGGGFDTFEDLARCTNEWRAVSEATCTRVPHEMGARVDAPAVEPRDIAWDAGVEPLFAEDFEEEWPEGWSMWGRWHTSECRRYQSDRSLAFSQPDSESYRDCPEVVVDRWYPSEESGWAVSPSVALPPDIPAELRWKTWFSTREYGDDDQPVDTKRILVSVDGAQPVALPAMAEVGPLGPANPDDADATATTGSEHHGPQKTWLFATGDLALFAGHSVQVIFAFDSVQTASPHEGWYVDDVQIVAAGATPPPVPDPSKCHEDVLDDRAADCAGSPPAVAVAAGDDHSCLLLQTGSVRCRGVDRQGEASDYDGLDAVAIATSPFHTCLVLVAGDVQCSDGVGRAGPGAAAVAVGWSHTCVLFDLLPVAGGKVDCWGTDGLGEAADDLVGDAVGLDARGGLTCIVTSAGNVRCHGMDDFGRTPQYLLGDAASVAVGEYRTCVVTKTGMVSCQGENWAGEGNPYNGGDAIAVAVGAEHTCILLDSGNVRCRGANYAGEAANYVGRDAIGVSAGPYYICILLEGGRVDCQGANDAGAGDDYAPVGPLAAQSGTADAGSPAPALRRPNLGLEGFELQPSRSDRLASDSAAAAWDKPLVLACWMSGSGVEFCKILTYAVMFLTCAAAGGGWGLALCIVVLAITKVVERSKI